MRIVKASENLRIFATIADDTKAGGFIGFKDDGPTSLYITMTGGKYGTVQYRVEFTADEQALLLRKLLEREKKGET